MDVNKIFEAMCDAMNNAYDSWDKALEEYKVENDDEEPNWDDSIIYWDGTKADWFNGGNAAIDSETSGMLRFGLTTMINSIDLVEKEVRLWVEERQ